MKRILLALIMTAMLSGCAAAATIPTAAPLTFVAIGDSITARGWPELLMTLDPQLVLLHNAGVDGNTTAQMLARVGPDALAYHPNVLTIMGGTNDIWTPEYSEAGTISNLTTMIHEARQYGVSTIVLVTIPPRVQAGYASVLPEIESLNGAIRALAASEKIILADAHAALAGPDGGWLPGYSDDGIHPSVDGRNALVGVVRAALS